tara:strand:+ start:41 stop:340 length:300 start_codon:yes stop_codon:yes gene_type:complete
MDIVIEEIIENKDDEKIKKFNEMQDKVIYYLNNRFKNLNEKLKEENKITPPVDLNTKTNIGIDLVKLAYSKLFGIPKDGNYECWKVELIKKHLKQKNLI